MLDKPVSNRTLKLGSIIMRGVLVWEIDWELLVLLLMLWTLIMLRGKWTTLNMGQPFKLKVLCAGACLR